MKSWLAVHCSPSSEALSASGALRLGWNVFYPRYYAIIRARKRRERALFRPYLPGYIFVEEGTGPSAWELSKLHGITSVLSNSIPDEDPVMKALIGMADSDGIIHVLDGRKPITRYRAGDRVVLKNCPLQLRQAVIESLDANRKGAWVWVEVFGGASVHVHVRDAHIGEVLPPVET